MHLVIKRIEFELSNWRFHFEIACLKIQSCLCFEVVEEFRRPRHICSIHIRTIFFEIFVIIRYEIISTTRKIIDNLV